MKYLKMSLNYSNSKFWYLLMISIIPAVLIAFVASPYATINFLCDYYNQDVSSFGTIYKTILDINTRIAWLGIVGVFVIPFSISILMGAIDRHMRMGEFSLGFDRILSRVNFNFMTSLKFSIVALIIYELNLFFQAIFFYAMASLFVPKVALILNIVWYVIMFIIMLFAFSLIILWVPTMLHTGLNSIPAFSLSVRQISKYLPSIALILSLPILPMILFMVLDSLLNLKIGILLDSVVLATMFVYYAILMYTIFYDINGIEREDLKAVDIWKKPY